MQRPRKKTTKDEVKVDKSTPLLKPKGKKGFEDPIFASKSPVQNVEHNSIAEKDSAAPIGANKTGGENGFEDPIFANKIKPVSKFEDPFFDEKPDED
jgi:hypothetical protein